VGVDLTAAIAVELVADVGVVTPEQFAPGPIARPHRRVRRSPTMSVKSSVAAMVVVTRVLG
jgi:hypothetical protein